MGKGEQTAVCAQISVPKKRGGPGAQSRLDYWEEADCCVAGVCQRWSGLVNDLFNSSEYEYIWNMESRRGEKRESPHARMLVRAKVFGIVSCEIKGGMKARQEGTKTSISVHLPFEAVCLNERDRQEEIQETYCKDESSVSWSSCVCVREKGR